MCAVCATQGMVCIVSVPTSTAAAAFVCGRRVQSPKQNSTLYINLIGRAVAMHRLRGSKNKPPAAHDRVHVWGRTA